MFFRVFFNLLFVFLISSYAKTIKLAPLPMANAEETAKIFLPFISYLEKKTNLKIELVWHKNYQDIIQGLEKNEIDLAYLGPLPYVILKSHSKHIKPIVGFYEKNGKKGYRCVLIASKLDSIPKDLTNKTLALTQASSTCGYFLTSGLLKKLNTNIENMKYRYEKKHTSVANAVLQGRYLLGGVKDSVAYDYEHLGLYVLEKSQEIPSFTLVANTKNIDEQKLNFLQKVLLDTPKKQYKHWGSKISHGMFKIEEKDFENIINIYKNIKIPQKGNF